MPDFRTGPLVLCFVLISISETGVWAASAWKLTYARQYGVQLTAGIDGQAELFATEENGDYAVAGFTNEFNSNLAIFGYTRVPPIDIFTPGNLRVVFDPNVQVYDFQVFDRLRSTDRSPSCYWRGANLPRSGKYRFEFWFRKIADDTRYEFFPEQPVFHYDRVVGFNTPTQEVTNFFSDLFSFSTWSEEHWQTFVVPQDINRIIAAKCFAIRHFGERFRIRLSIHEGGVDGPQVGPSATSREVVSNEFVNVKISWGMEDVIVVPGQTYALKATWPGGFNMVATEFDNYAQGQLYNGTTAVPSRDMVAVIVGARRLPSEPASVLRLH